MATNDMLSDPAFMNLYMQNLANQRWQNQLASGLNIANAGWRTGLGLAMGTGLGAWLGNKFGNWVMERDYKKKYGNRNPSSPVGQAELQATYPYLFPNGSYDLGWSPPQQYPFPATQAERLAGIGSFNPNWRQDFINRQYPIPNFWSQPTPATSDATANPQIQPQQTTAPQAQQGQPQSKIPYPYLNHLGYYDLGWVPKYDMSQPTSLRDIPGAPFSIEPSKQNSNYPFQYPSVKDAYNPKPWERHVAFDNVVPSYGF